MLKAERRFRMDDNLVL